MPGKLKQWRIANVNTIIRHLLPNLEPNPERDGDRPRVTKYETTLIRNRRSIWLATSPWFPTWTMISTRSRVLTSSSETRRARTTATIRPSTTRILETVSGRRWDTQTHRHLQRKELNSTTICRIRTAFSSQESSKTIRSKRLSSNLRPSPPSLRKSNWKAGSIMSTHRVQRRSSYQRPRATRSTRACSVSRIFIRYSIWRRRSITANWSYQYDLAREGIEIQSTSSKWRRRISAMLQRHGQSRIAMHLWRSSLSRPQPC